MRDSNRIKWVSAIRPRALFSLIFQCMFLFKIFFFARFSFYFIKLCVWILDLGCVPMLLYNAIRFHRNFYFVRLLFFRTVLQFLVSGHDSYEIENILTPYIRFFSIRLSNSFISFFVRILVPPGKRRKI